MSERKDLTKTDKKDVEKTKTTYSAIPAVDIYENDNEILLHADMPGVLKQDISVNIKNGTLSLSGIRKLECPDITNWEEFGDVEYIRSFSVPQTIDIDKVEADLKDGVLKLHLPKSESEKPRQIEIKTV